MLKTRNPANIAPPAAMYSHSVEIPPNARWLVTAGQVGVTPEGEVPEGFEAQHDLIWQNTLKILEDAGFGPEHIVRLRAADLPDLTTALTLPSLPPTPSRA